MGMVLAIGGELLDLMVELSARVELEDVGVILVIHRKDEVKCIEIVSAELSGCTCAGDVPGLECLAHAVVGTFASVPAGGACGVDDKVVEATCLCG